MSQHLLPPQARATGSDLGYLVVTVSLVLVLLCTGAVKFLDLYGDRAVGRFPAEPDWSIRELLRLGSHMIVPAAFLGIGFYGLLRLTILVHRRRGRSSTRDRARQGFL